MTKDKKMLWYSFIVNFKYLVQETATEVLHFLDIETLLELTNLNKQSVANLEMTKDKIEKAG